MKFLSTKINTGAFSAAMLILRLGLGILMMNHGYNKIENFSQYKASFMNWMGLGSTTSLIFVIFSEFFCSILLVLGLFTRLATIPLIITMAVIVITVAKGDVFDKGELAALFLAGYITLLIAGPGRASVDAMISK